MRPSCSDPGGSSKPWLTSVGTLPWLGYALGFLLVTLAIIPGIFWLVSMLGQVLAGNKTALKGKGVKKAFTSLAYTLVPLGMTAWIAFTLSFIFANGSYILPSLSDPLGFGWNLFGTAGMGWTPYLSGIVPFMQVIVLLVGLAWASRTALKIARQLASQARLPQEAARAHGAARCGFLPGDHHVTVRVAHRMRSSTLALGLLLLLALGLPLLAAGWRWWDLRSGVVEVHARMPDAGGWSPASIQRTRWRRSASEAHLRRRAAQFCHRAEHFFGDRPIPR